MTTRQVLMAGAIVLIAGAAWAQGGPGPGRGRMMELGSNNVSGWSMMTVEERTAHRDRMHNMKSLEECKTYMAEHAKLMEARAKERGIKHPGPRESACETMQSRGRFK